MQPGRRDYRLGCIRNDEGLELGICITLITSFVMVCEYVAVPGMEINLNYVPRFQDQTAYLNIAMNHQPVGKIDLEQGWHDYDIMVPGSFTKKGYNVLALTPGTDFKTEKKTLAGISVDSKDPGNLAVAMLQFTPLAPFRGMPDPLLPAVKPKKARLQ